MVREISVRTPSVLPVSLCAEAVPSSLPTAVTANKTIANIASVIPIAASMMGRREDELSALRGESPPGAADFLRQRLRKFEEYFGVKTHDDIRASLEVLNPSETAALLRVFVEAFWNVAKHSGASNLYLESRRVGSVLIARVRDDGHGFDTGRSPQGFGLKYMRRRAGEVGADLDVISTPGRGTSVQVRFRKRQYTANP